MKKTDTNTSIADSIDITASRAKYDAACKRLLSEKVILARILKECVQEFADCDVKDIAEKYIEGNPIVGEYPVERDILPHIQGMPNEDKTLFEGTVVYDIRFNALAPTTGEVIRLIINVEAQNQSDPGYPLVKRAIYYCGRLLSSQHGTEFNHSEYDKVKKVYSIWICPEAPKERANTITSYHITEKNLVGKFREKVRNYDLLCAVMVCLGETEDENKYGLLRMLEVLFSGDINAREKKEILEEDFSIPMSEKIEREVEGMCNLSQGIWDRGRKKGHVEGHAEGIDEGIILGHAKGITEKGQTVARVMLEHGEPIEKIKLYSGCTDAEIIALIKAQPTH